MSNIAVSDKNLIKQTINFLFQKRNIFLNISILLIIFYAVFSSIAQMAFVYFVFYVHTQIRTFESQEQLAIAIPLSVTLSDVTLFSWPNKTPCNASEEIFYYLVLINNFI